MSAFKMRGLQSLNGAKLSRSNPPLGSGTQADMTPLRAILGTQSGVVQLMVES